MQENIAVKRVLVTGATGKIGSRLVRRLAAQDDIAVRVFARNAAKAAPLISSGAELAVGTLEDAPAVRAALDGIDTLVLITAASPLAAGQASALLAAAKETCVRKIVRISVFKAAVDGPTDITRQHGRTDSEIQASGLTFTILRPPFFMQNLCLMVARTIVSTGKLYFGTGDGKLAMIDLRDIVDCVEHSVVSDAYDNQVFTLTGPESISFHDIAGRLTDILGRPVHYVSVPPEAVEQSIRAMGMGEWYAQVMRDFCRAYSENWGDLTTDCVARITGRAPRSFDAFAREVMVPALVVAAPPRS
jgi:NAD(P)H dehydrogenase (quinone)